VNGLNGGGPDETIADLLVDGGLPLNEPELPPEGNGAISAPLYAGLAPIAPPLTPGLAAELACGVNLLGL
jgi:hypothetical protein